MANSLQWISIDNEITNGIVGWWKFSEGTGTTTADSSGNGNTGTLSGTPLPTWGTAPGGLFFNNNAGDRAYVDMGSPAVLQLTSAGTVCCWMYQTSAATYAALVVFMDFTNTQHGYFLGSHINNFSWFLGAASAQGDFEVPSFSDTTWTHWGITWNSTVVNLYKNGTTIGYSPITETIVPDAAPLGHKFTVGCYEGTANPFVGNIDDVRVYNRALSKSEMVTLFHNGRQ